MSLRVNRAWEHLFGYTESCFLEHVCRLGGKRAFANLFTASYAEWGPLLFMSVLTDPHHSSSLSAEIVDRAGRTVRTIISAYVTTVRGSQALRFVQTFTTLVEH